MAVFTDAGIRAWAEAHASTVNRRLAAQRPPPLPAPAPTPVTGVRMALRSSMAPDTKRIALGALPDGRLLLATTGEDRVVRVWNGHTGERIHTLTGHSSVVTSLAWAILPDGRALLASFDGHDGAHVWDGRTGAELYTVSARATAIRGAAWAVVPDGRLLLATSNKSQDDTSCSVDIWDGYTGAHLRTISWLEAHAPGRRATSVTGLAWTFSPGGQLLLATTSDDNTVRIWDGDDCTLIHTHDNGDDAVFFVDWTVFPDGRPLLAANSKQRSGPDSTLQSAIMIFDHTGTLLNTLSSQLEEVTNIAWAPLSDGRLVLAVSSISTPARLWDGHTGRPLEVIEIGQGNIYGDIAWARPSDGELLLATVTGTGHVDIWEIALDPPVSAPDERAADDIGPSPTLLEQVENVTSTVWPDAEPAMKATWAILPDGQARLATTATLNTVSGHHEGALREDIDRWNTLRIWDGRTGTALQTISAHSRFINKIDSAVLPDGRLLLATSSKDGTASVWDGLTGQLLQTVTSTNDHDVRSVALVTSSEGHVLLATCNGMTAGTSVWDGATGRPLHELTGHTGPVATVTGTRGPDGRVLIATCSEDGTARIWDGATGQLIHTLAHRSGGSGLGVHMASWAVLPNGDLLLSTASAGNTVRVWDAASGRLLRTIQHETTVWDIASAVLPDGRFLLATGSTLENAEINLWDGHTGNHLRTLRSSSGVLNSLSWALLPEGRLILATASKADVSEQLWEVRLRPPVPPTGRRPTAMASVPAAYDLELIQTGLLALGSASVWQPFGLLADLILLTASESTPRRPLNDERLEALAEHPGIRRLRALGWPPRARMAIAGLLASHLEPLPDYQPPASAAPGQLRVALKQALTVPVAVRPVGMNLDELRAAADTITDRTIALLTVLGAAACAADPALPLRLAHRIPHIPVLAARRLQLLTTMTQRQPARRERRVGGTPRHTPGTAGITRQGPLTNLLPTQLALPRSLLTLRHLEGQLLYRRHIAYVPPTPRPVTLILDTTPPTHGPAEQVLRLAAHLITTTLWEYDEHPVLISLSRPEAAIPLTGRIQLAELWTTRTLDPPGPALAAALDTARATPQPVVFLTHHHTPHGRYVPGHGHRLLTTHHPPEPAPPAPVHAEHHHLDPNPSQARLATVVTALIALSDGG